MRGSVALRWRGRDEVVAGLDPWEVVDEAWASMAARGFSHEGPFVAHACTVARNKAIDAMKRAEVRRLGPSLDVGEPHALPAVDSAEDAYLEAVEDVESAGLVVLIEDAMRHALDEPERRAFVAVRMHGKSCAAVGRESDPPVSGQWIGQLLARAMIKIHRYVTEHHSSALLTGDETDA